MPRFLGKNGKYPDLDSPLIIRDLNLEGQIITDPAGSNRS